MTAPAGDHFHPELTLLGTGTDLLLVAADLEVPPGQERSAWFVVDFDEAR